MQEISKAAHLVGKQHTSNLAKSRLAAAPLVRASPAQVQAIRASSPPVTWRCSICNIGMQLISKDAHEAGRSHLARMGAILANNGGVFSRVPIRSFDVQPLGGPSMAQPQPRPQPSPPPPPSPSMQWTCEFCHVTMDVDLISSHIAEEGHIARQLSSADRGVGPTISNRTDEDTTPPSDYHVPSRFPAGVPPRGPIDPYGSEFSSRYSTGRLSPDDTASIFPETDIPLAVISEGEAHEESPSGHDHDSGPGIDDYF
ncbi:hypothetical protein BOTBODRAFT_29262 [Botryobasidium botryosum FD-172 SS1]|uniref:Uncharacterized protein n=1 Tax=Botryobasidium botryosum (strain FD-172 SS1) TaxID=930990 RepID=A0A067N1D3_BOTB1|nr:hypothetical protein BOTBODRAFT_29262 [Botryobasidium botryosum FD-172 SS1]